MKKIYLLFLSVLPVTFCNAQLTGTKTIPGDYATLALAITDLNTVGVGAGGVTINMNIGETAPAGGYVIGGVGSLVLTTSSVANPIVINGVASTITAPTPQASGNLNDAIFKLIGADWVTINGFTMRENIANTVTAAGTNTMTEWGVALLYVTATDGAQNDKISNNNIALDRTYQNTFGIYANATHTAGAVTTSATATGAAGGNSGLKIYSNFVTNVNNGIVVLGPTAAADNNNGIDIGGASAATGNSVTNYGTTGTFSGYANVSGTVNGILVRNSTSANISYNTISSSVGGVSAGTLNGIQIPASSNAPTITFTNNINNNTISLQSGLAAGAMNGINLPSGSASTASTLNINNNDFNTFGHTVPASGAIIFILTASAHQFTNITGNTFTNITVNTTGGVTFISHGYAIPVTGQLIMSNNSIVTGFTRTSAGALTISTSNSTSGTGSVCNYIGNNFSNITLTGASTVLGFNNTDGGTGSTKTVTGNTFNNWLGTTNSITCMNFTYWNGVSSLSNNTIANIGGQSSIVGVVIGSTANNATSILVSGNTINNLTSSGTGGTVTGLSCSNTSPLISITGNKINALSSTGASAVSGIVVSGANAAGTAVSKNNIYNLSGSNASSTVNGISVSAGTLINVYNNFISDLRATAANATVPIYGINNSGGTNIGIYYNTIALGKGTTLTSSGANFGVTGIGYSSTAGVTMRNNIVWIDATPAGTGTVAAVRRSAAGVAGTAPLASNFNSNNNIYNVQLTAGAPPVAANINKYLYVEGTVTASVTNGFGIDIGQADVPAQNLKSDPGFNGACGKYKTFIGALEGGTFNENNLTASGSPNFTFVPVGSSLASNSAQVISSPSITDDYNSITRSATTPDIGALEFSGISIDATPPAISYTPLANTVCLGAPTLNAVITDASGVEVTPGLAPRLYYRKGGAVAEADVFLNYPAQNTNAFNGWKYVEATGSAPNFNFTFDYSKLTSPVVAGDSITYFIIAQDIVATPNVGKNAVTFPVTFCPTSVVIPPAGAVPTSASQGYMIGASAIATVQPSVAGISSGTTNQQVLRIDLNPSNCGNVTQINFANLTTNIADISKARVYYTTTAVFSTGVQFGTDVINPGNPGPAGVFIVTGNLTPSTTLTNYFWLVFDIACNAPLSAGDAADASVNSITIGGTPFVPTTPNPAGTRVITAALAGDNITSAPVALIGTAVVNTYATLGRTLEPGEPSPILNAQGGNQSGQSNYSWGTAASSSCWFKLVVPVAGEGSSGNLVIRAATSATSSSTDGQIAVWDFPNMTSGCGVAPDFSNARLLQANDDKISTEFTTIGADASNFNPGVRCRLTPGNTYYIQVDGFGAATPDGQVFVEDLSFPPYSVANNGFGNILSPSGATPDMRPAAYEVNGADGWTYYYENNATANLLSDDRVLMAVNWGAAYFYNGTYLPGTTMADHLRGSARNLVLPSTGNALVSSDSIVVWVGRNSANQASNDINLTDGGYVQTLHWWMINKFWNLIPKNQPSSAVGVRTFYSNSDFTALQTTVTGGGGVLLNHTDMQFIKATKGGGLHFSNAEVDPSGGHTTLTAGTVTNLSWTNTDGVQAGADPINQAQFPVPSFSGGGGGSTGTPLIVVPVSIEFFRGSKLAGSNYLSWKVNCTSAPSLTLVLERSGDGRNFGAIHNQTATATRCLQGFNYTDVSAPAGISYYRLRIITPDGAYKYSNIVALINGDKGFDLISVAPNPVRGETVLTVTSAKGGKMDVSVTDLAGRVVMQRSLTIIAGNNPINLDFSLLGAGTYRITAINADAERKTIPFVKY